MMRSEDQRRQVTAVAEVLAVATAYIFISTTAVGEVDASSLFPIHWSSQERTTGSGFLIGALIQVFLVLLAAYALNLSDVRRAIAATVEASTTKGWLIAGAASAIHIGTGATILPEPERIWELSALNVILSPISAVDGWSQEVLFRGYVLFRLARADFPVFGRIFISGALFAAIHLGYTGEAVWDILSPLIGTFMLGCFYAWAVHSGRGSLKPVIVGHVLVILLLQPWLALAY